MRVEKPELNPMAKLAIGKLAEAGVVVSPEEVLWLQHLAENCHKTAGGGDPIDWVDIPTRVGNMDFWPLSLGAEIWLFECAYPWFQDSDFWTTLSEAFAMAYSRNPAAVQAACDPKTAKRMLKAFASQMGCSWDALYANVRKILKRTPEIDLKTEAHTGQEPTAVKWGDVIAAICHYAGGTPEDWLWKRSAVQVRAVMDGMINQQQTDANAVSDTKAHALLAFKLATEEIRKRGNG